MKRLKIVVLTRCPDCPNHYDFSGRWECLLANRAFHNDDMIPDIPGWCPMPNYDDGRPEKND